MRRIVFAPVAFVLAMMSGFPMAAHSQAPWAMAPGGHVKWEPSGTNNCCVTVVVEVSSSVPQSWSGTAGDFGNAADLAIAAINSAAGTYFSLQRGGTSCRTDAHEWIDVYASSDAPSWDGIPTLGFASVLQQPATGVIDYVAIDIYLGHGFFQDWTGSLFEDRYWRNRLNAALMHEMGHAIGMADNPNSTGVMKTPLVAAYITADPAFTSSETSTIVSVYSASKAICDGGSGPAYLAAVDVRPSAVHVGRTALIVETELEERVSGVAISYSLAPVSADADFVEIAAIDLTNPGGGGVYVVEHDVAYPPTGSYLLEAFDLLEMPDGKVLISPPPSTSVPLASASSVEEMRAQNLSMIRRDYWREVATGLRNVSSITEFTGSGCEYLVVAYHEFVRDIAPICDYWETMAGIDVRLVSVNGAIHTAEMVKNYLAWIDQRDELRAIWLVGVPAKPDQQNPEFDQNCLVPTHLEYHDYFFADAGDWGAMEYDVGRLPAKSSDEVAFYVNKELRYHWEVSWGGRKDPASYSNQLVVSVPDVGEFPDPTTWGPNRWAVVNNAETVRDVLYGVAASGRWNIGWLDITQLPGYGSGYTPTANALRESFGERMIAGQHVVHGLTAHNSSGFQFRAISAANWLDSTTDGQGRWRRCHTFWMTPNCFAASPYCNPSWVDPALNLSYRTIAAKELFGTMGLIIFGSSMPSWNSVIGDVAPLMARKIMENDDYRGRPKSIGTAWRETHNEILASSGIRPTGLEFFGILGDPMLYVRGVYDEAAEVALESTAPLAIAASPSPFNGRVQLRLTGLRAGGGRLDIYDVRGRRICRFEIEHTAGDSRAIEWRGVDEAGRPVGSGVYYARLENAGMLAIRKLVYLK